VTVTRMTKLVAMAIGTALAAVTTAAAQQGGAIPGGRPSSSTPGVAVGTTGTTYGTPGANPMSATPGGTVPMAAGTQDMSNAPLALPNYNNTGRQTGTRR
jgi:hypothetical protein